MKHNPHRAVKIDGTVLASGVLLLGIGMVAKDSELRLLGISAIMAALPRPSEYPRVFQQVMAFLGRRKA